jgi:orotate phosphoribosyltransferase
MADDIARLLPFRDGHFRLESGHHGERWVDLERLCLDPEPIRALAEELARRLASHEVEVVCGPLVEGAFVALMAAPVLGARFVYSERFVDETAEGLYPVRYRLPRVLHSEVKGRRVAIVNDVISAGSAVRGTFQDLVAQGAHVVVVAALAVLGPSASQLTRESGVVLEALATLPYRLWAPGECPLCADGVPLVDPGRHGEV